MINWLAGDEQLITIQPMPLKDVNVTIPNDSKSVFLAWTIFHSFQYFIPVTLFIAGFVIWFRRQKLRSMKSRWLINIGLITYSFNNLFLFLDNFSKRAC